MNVLKKISGSVQDGHKRGKDLGFPTINVHIDEKIDEGIYISQTIINDKIYHSLTFIGEAKTFNETEYQTETYILNFSQDIYGQVVTIHLLQKLRDNQKFESVDELIEQMKKDKKDAIAYFSKQ